MKQIALKDLLEAGCHFGHKAERWHPKAAEFIFEKREGIHIIDLAKTKEGLEKAAEFLYTLGKKGKTALFVGTKRQAAVVIKNEAKRVGAPYFSKRWVGGFITNWEQVHKNLEKIRKLKKEEADGVWQKYPKHERVKLRRYVSKLESLYGGVTELSKPPDALVVVDIKREKVAVTEVTQKGIPIVAIVDTNSDPTSIDYKIPANDDAVGAIEYLVHHLAQAYKEGMDLAKKHAKDDEKQKPSDLGEKTDEEPRKSEAEEKEKEKEKKAVVTQTKEETDKIKAKPKKRRGRPKKIN